MAQHSNLSPLLASLSTANRRSFSHTQLNQIRDLALNRLLSEGLPQRKSESWRFFDTRPLERTSFTLASRKTNASHSSFLEPFFLEEAKGSTVVVLNGVVDQELSDTHALQDVLLDAVENLDDQKQTQIIDNIELSSRRAFAKDPFVLMNTASFDSLSLLEIPPDTHVAQPIHIIYLIDDSAGEGGGAMAHPRLFVSVGAHSKVTLIEEWLTLSGRPFVNSFTQIELKLNATLRHIRLQRSGEEAFHVDRLAVEIGEQAKYDSCSYSFGSLKARSDIHLLMGAREGWARLDGVAVLAGKQEVDTHSVIENQSPHVTSHQLHKIVASHESHGVFNGNILVRPGAQHIKAYQLNRNLLLGEKSRVDTKPQLEIFADDVECSHGSATGQLDENQLFYLQTRGIPYADARATLTYAFAAEVIENIEIPSLKERLIHETYQRIQKA